jgi:hypothetical protein
MHDGERVQRRAVTLGLGLRLAAGGDLLAGVLLRGVGGSLVNVALRRRVADRRARRMDTP